MGAIVSERPRKYSILMRSLALQLFLNYKTMQGAGYLFSLKSELRGAEEQKVRAAASFINGHPVFSSAALGSLCKLLRENTDDVQLESLKDWKRQLSTPLGAIGDSLIWERWKPALLAIVCTAALWYQGNAVTAWLWVVPVVLLVYNISLWQFRSWAFDAGFRLGADVTDLALHPSLPRIRGALRVLGIVSAAAVLGGALQIFIGASPTGVLQFGAGFAIMICAAMLRLSTLTACFLALLVSFLITYLYGQI